jgi:hypothetical protein
MLSATHRSIASLVGATYQESIFVVSTLGVPFSWFAVIGFDYLNYR